MKVQNIFK